MNNGFCRRGVGKVPYRWEQLHEIVPGGWGIEIVPFICSLTRAFMRPFGHAVSAFCRAGHKLFLPMESCFQVLCNR